MAENRRRLPHLYPPGKWLFITWHLHGSLPEAVYPPADLKRAGRAFVWMDRYLDTTRSGPMFLNQEPVATLVVNALHDGVRQRHYELDAFVIMANHVHVLILPTGMAGEVLRKLKGGTARKANLLLKRTGDPFWERESYDHWVRDDAELVRIRAYIENNPVKAGLCATPEDYGWSSACKQGAAWRG